MNISETDLQRIISTASVLDERGPTARTRQSELAALLSVFRRRWRTWAITTAAVVFLAACWLLVTTPQYTSVSALLIETNRSPPAPAETEHDRVIDPVVIESQIAALTSEGIARRVIAKLDLSHDPEFTGPGLWSKFTRLFSFTDKRERDAEGAAIAHFDRSLKVTRVGRSYLAEIAFTSLVPQKAADIANAIAEVYIQDQLGAKLAAAQRAGAWMQAHTEKLRLDSEAAARAVAQFRDAHAGELAAGEAPATEAARRLQATADDQRNAYEAMQTRSRRLRQFVHDQSLPLPQTRLITEARPPTQPSSPRIALVLLLALAGGGLLGAGAAFARDRLDHRIRDLGQLRDAVGGRRALTMTWPRRFRSSTEIVWPVLRQWQTDHHGEALRRIRTEIDRRLGTSTRGPIALMSPRAGDGRATFTCALAAALAAGGHRTLLIDADHRHAALTKALAPGATVTLNALLHNGPGDGENVVRLKCGLDFVPASSTPAAACDLLTSPKMAGVVRQLVNNYDYVLIDVPPMLEGPDAAVVASAVDGCILSVHSDCSSVEDVVRAVDETYLLPQHVIATVLFTSRTSDSA
jgi:uncharacterized protein involved in exopolysaccharide biosynthesis/Mrp family chromosome partitioning ATPase